MSAGVVFDLEIMRSPHEVGGWEHVAKMGVSVAVGYVFEPGIVLASGAGFKPGFHAFTDAQSQDANQWMLDWPEPWAGSFSYVDASVDLLNAASFVVGYNHVAFDYRVLEGHTGKRITQGRNCDLCTLFERRVSLDAVGRCELGMGKGMDSATLPRLYRQGRVREVLAECRRHVEITRLLYDRLWRFQSVKLPLGRMTVPRAHLHPWEGVQRHGCARAPEGARRRPLW